MKFTPALTLATLLISAVGLAGCSGDDSSKKSEAGKTSGDNASFCEEYAKFASLKIEGNKEYDRIQAKVKKGQQPTPKELKVLQKARMEAAAAWARSMAKIDRPDGMSKSEANGFKILMTMYAGAQDGKPPAGPTDANDAQDVAAFNQWVNKACEAEFSAALKAAQESAQ